MVLITAIGPGPKSNAMPDFTLDPRLEADTVFVKTGPVSDFRLMNDARFPWLVLIPRATQAFSVDDVPAAQRASLMEEIVCAGNALKDVTGARKINWASLGNHVPQLHIHVIARFNDDPAWPKPVWGVGQVEPYPAGSIEAFAQRIADALP